MTAGAMLLPRRRASTNRMGYESEQRLAKIDVTSGALRGPDTMLRQ